MEYQGDSSQYYYNYSEVQLANASNGYSNYFASDINSHVGVASYDNPRYVASPNTFDEYYDQEPMCAENSLSYNSSSNIQHVNPYSSAINSHYVVPPQDMPMNERIVYDDVNYLANYSPDSAPYANAHINNSASCVAQSSSQIHEISAICANVNTQNSASHVAQSSSRIDERWISGNTHNSASILLLILAESMRIL
jgi:hypothetical protein